ncbi:MAG TPA: LuxR C-terminal-related transcriptional regulator [Desulfomonilaceae bacterium]|nr:LuxR C-terminal-related transcriptional regulator [Desulfomonilaceae bacterium]
MSDKDEAKPQDSKKPSQRAQFLEADHLSTQTIDLSNLLTNDVTTSGSFAVRGGIWATAFGKLMRALPIPVMLVDKSYQVTVANEACGKIPLKVPEIQGILFHDFFPDPTVADDMQSVLEEVFAARKPLAVETVVGHLSKKIWCRMTFRSIRMGGDQFALIVIEDLTAEKRALILKLKQEQLLLRHRDELEKRIQERTIDLSKANDALRIMIEGVQERVKEEQQRISKNLEILVKPLVDQLKSEHLPEYVRSLVETLEICMKNVFGNYNYDVAKVFSNFTPREMQVADLLRSGLSSKQIASVMGITVEGVNYHRQNIRKKLGVEVTGKFLSVWLREHFVRED